MEIVSQFREKMEEHNLGVKDVAVEVGVSHKTLQRVVGGKVNPSDLTLKAMERWVVGTSEVSPSSEIVLVEQNLKKLGGRVNEMSKKLEAVVNDLNEVIRRVNHVYSSYDIPEDSEAVEEDE